MTIVSGSGPQQGKKAGGVETRVTYDSAQANVAFSVLVQAASALVRIDTGEVLRWAKEIRKDDLQSQDPAIRASSERIMRFIEVMRGVQEQLQSTPIPRFKRVEQVADKPPTR